MFWMQKAALLCSTTGRANTLQSQIESRLAGKDLRVLEVEQSSNQGTVRPNLIVVVQYNVKADADQVWTDITTADTNKWIVTPSFAAYGEMNDDGSLSQLLGRIDW